MNQKEIAEAQALIDSVRNGTGPLTPAIPLFPSAAGSAALCPNCKLPLSSGEGCHMAAGSAAPATPGQHPPSNKLIHDLARMLPEELKTLYCTMSPVPLEQIRSRLIVAFEEVANDQYVQAYEFISRHSSAAPATKPLDLQTERAKIFNYLYSKGRTMPDDDYAMFEAGWLAARFYDAESEARVAAEAEQGKEK